jgi:hypothetical protein
MGLFFSIIQIVAAILMPISTVVLSYLIVRYTRQGELTTEVQTCQRCGQSREGAQGEFHYTEDVGSPRQQMARGQSIITEESILGSESHFICNSCAHRFLHFEILQQVLVVIPYPLYLFVIVPFFLSNGAFGNFLIEIFLLIFSLAGAASAWNLYRSVRMGETPLAEARDRVAIQERKKTLGKGYSYFTRTAMRYYEKPSSN